MARPSWLRRRFAVVFVVEAKIEGGIVIFALRLDSFAVDETSLARGLAVSAIVMKAGGTWVEKMPRPTTSY